jgi:AcrR family transcriptional regulator
MVSLSRHYVTPRFYSDSVPKLWRETIGEHQEQVRGAILDAAEELAVSHGPLSLTMSKVAEATGIGRATLYKYFADVEAIMQAWHERHLRSHVEQMSRIADGPGDAFTLLEAVLLEYATALSHSHQGDLGAVLHRHAGMADAQRQLTDLLERLIAAAVRDGSVRSDVPVRELAAYCLHALAASRHRRRPGAARRLVDVTLDGLAGRHE